MSAPSRAVPFYCPYCADEDLRPFDPPEGSAGHGQWHCRSCRRAFELKFLGSTGGWNESEPQAHEQDRSGGQQATSKGGTA